MKHDKKAVLFLTILIIATLGVVVLLGVLGWKYVEDGFLGGVQDAYDEYLAEKEDADKEKSTKDKSNKDKSDKDYMEYVYEFDPEQISDFAIEDILKEIESVEAVISDKTVTEGTVGKESARTNLLSPEERVFDYADVLTDEEEEKLRVYIAECEEECAMDIVILILDEDMEASGLEWGEAMQKRAENFYDDNYFGYNEPYGDGVLFLDNWYGEQAGSYIVTSGKQVDMLTDEELGNIFDEVFAVINEDPCEAYRIFVEMVSEN